MSLANFFDKSALAAPAILKGFDLAELKQRLESHVVAIQFDEEAVKSHEGRTTLELLMNLLARLYPRICLVSVGNNLERFSNELRILGEKINPLLTWEINATEASVCVAVGKT